MNVAAVSDERSQPSPPTKKRWECDGVLRGQPCERLLAVIINLHEMSADLVIRCGKCGKDNALSDVLNDLTRLRIDE